MSDMPGTRGQASASQSDTRNPASKIKKQKTKQNKRDTEGKKSQKPQGKRWI